MLDLGPIKAYLAEVERSGNRPHPDLVALVAEVERQRKALADTAGAIVLADELQKAQSAAWQLIGQCDMAFEQMATLRRISEIRVLAKKMRAKIEAKLKEQR